MPQLPPFEAPGPGPWELETAHFPKPFPRFGLDAVMRGFVRGFSEGSARYGLLLSHFEPAIVNGFWYQQPIAFGAPKGAMGPPPKPILWALTRLHPAMRARIATGEKALLEKRWRDDLRMWDEVDKPGALEAHRRLLAVDVTALDDGALGDHLRVCETHIGEMIYLHHKYTTTAIMPVGDFLVQTSDWTGKSPGEVLALLRGSSSISLGFSRAELDAVRTALARDPAASAVLASGDGGAGTLASLMEGTSEVATAVRALVELVRHRALNYDISEPTPGELPDVVVKAIRAAVAGKFDPRPDEARARTAELRALVPEAERGRFDEALEEARAVNRIRDERGMYADCWAIGIGRRAALEVGARLVARGRLHAATEGVDLSVDEAVALLAGTGGPSADEVAARAAFRRTHTVADCPPFLRAMPAPPPDPAVLPPAARRSTRAVGAVITQLFQETDRTSTATVIRGISVNQGVYEGVARLVDSAADFPRIEQGDVLVTRSTAPYFNVVLPLLGAIVTDRGGQLCHAAIVAREYGIPGIVGTREATARIPDGARVRVDGTTGEVTLL